MSETPEIDAHLAALWERARPYLAEAVEHCGGTHTVEDVLKGILEGQLLLWVGERCAAVSEVMRFPRRRVLNMFLAGGDWTELEALKPGIEAFARGQACKGMQSGAKVTPKVAGILQKISGWTRRAPDYTPKWVQFTKELT